MFPCEATVLVLGSTGAVGGALARRLVGMTDDLIVHGHDADSVEQLQCDLSKQSPEARIRGLTADFRSLVDTRSMIGKLHADTASLGLLVNAVDAQAPATRTVTENGHETTWQVNYLAPALVILGTLGLMDRYDRGRIVNVVPVRSRMTRFRIDRLNVGERYRPRAIHDLTKLSVLMFGQTLAARLSPEGRSVVSCDPGKAGVDTIAFACTSSEQLNGLHLTGYRPSPLPPEILDHVAQRTLWDYTCSELGLKPSTGQPWRFDNA